MANDSNNSPFYFRLPVLGALIEFCKNYNRRVLVEAPVVQVNSESPQREPSPPPREPSPSLSTSGSSPERLLRWPSPPLGLHSQPDSPALSPKSSPRGEASPAVRESYQLQPLNYAEITVQAMNLLLDQGSRIDIDAIPPHRHDLYRLIFQWAVFQENDALLDELLDNQERCQRIKQDLFNYASSYAKPERYAYIEALRKKGVSVDLSQRHLNRQIRKLAELNANAAQASGDLRAETDARKVVAEIQKANGYCHGWALTEFFNSCKNQPGVASLARWWSAAKYEFSIWDGTSAALQETVELPDAERPTKLGNLFERLSQMVLAHQGFVVGDLHVTQQDLTSRRSHQRNDSSFFGVEGVCFIPDSHTVQMQYLNQQFDIFSMLTPQQVKQILEKPELVAVAENGLITFRNANHILYLSMYRNDKGELRYQLFDSNFAAGRLSLARLSLAAQKVLEQLGPAVQMTGYTTQQEKASSSSVDLREVVFQYLEDVAPPRVSADTLGLLLRVELDVAVRHLAYFAHLYVRVVNEPFTASYAHGVVIGTLVEHLLLTNSFALLKEVVNRLSPDLNLPISGLGVIPLVYLARQNRFDDEFYALINGTSDKNLEELFYRHTVEQSVKMLVCGGESHELRAQTTKLWRAFFAAHKQIDLDGFKFLIHPKMLTSIYETLGADGVRRMLLAAVPKIPEETRFTFLINIHQELGVGALREIFPGAKFKKDLIARLCPRAPAHFARDLWEIIAELEVKSADGAAVLKNENDGAQSQSVTPRRGAGVFDKKPTMPQLRRRAVPAQTRG